MKHAGKKRRKSMRMNEWLQAARRYIDQSRIISGAILLLVMTICLILLIKMPVILGEQDVTEGLPLKENIYSNIDFRWEDKKSSEDAGRISEAQIPLYYKMNESVRNEQLHQFDELDKALRNRIGTQKNTAVQIEESLNPGSVQEKVQQLSGNALEAFRQTATAGRLSRCMENWKNIIQTGILPDSESRKKQDSPADTASRLNEKILVYSNNWSRTTPLARTDYYHASGAAEKMTQDVCLNFPFDKDPDGRIKNEIRTLFLSLIKPNLTNDGQMTEAKRTAARNAARVYREISAGQILLPVKEKLSGDDVALYQAYRHELEQQIGGTNSVRNMLRLIALTLALTFFICIYIWHVHPEVVSSNHSIWVLGGISMFSLIVFRIAAGVFLGITSELNIPQLLVVLIVPLALPTILISVIFGFRSAIFVGLFTSGIAAFALNNSFPVFVTGLLVCCAAGFSVRYTTDYKHFFLRAFTACFLTTVFASAVFMGDYLFRSMPDNLSAPQTEQTQTVQQDDGKVFGVQVFIPGKKELTPEVNYRIHTVAKGLILLPLISGLITALLALLTLFLLESVFRVVSNMSYTSYTDRNHPLLQKLRQDAPGTYLHSERVAQLVEEAAKKIDLNPIQMQACALFHDVGKLVFPGMFTENNAPGENQHGGFLPVESAGFIRQHVEHGVELAKKNKLPPLLQKAIRSHHGTDLISFFYGAAKERAEENHEQGELQEQDFRYKGPLVGDREITLLTLADACEAAVASLKREIKQEHGEEDHFNRNIRDMVNRIFEKKHSSGQLELSELTLHELAVIRESFIETLTSIHKNQRRTAYPEERKEKA